MPVKASLKHLHIAPRKVRLVADVIRGMDVINAENQLNFFYKNAGEPLLKLLTSAISNATHNFGMEKDNLYIKTIFVDGGPVLKRWMPRAFGRAYPIRKRTCHINIELEEKVKGKKRKKVIKASKEIIKAESKDKLVKKDKKYGLKKEGKKGFGKKFGNIKNKLFQRKSI